MTDEEQAAIRSACLFGLVTQNHGQKVRIRRDALDPFLSADPPEMELSLKLIDEEFYELSITEQPPAVDVDVLPY